MLCAAIIKSPRKHVFPGSCVCMHGLYVFGYAVAILGLVHCKRTNVHDVMGVGREGENGVSAEY